MLNFIREKAKGWVAGVIVGLIAIPFALWGVNSYISGPSSVIVAKVNGEPISQVEFQRTYQQYRDRMRRTLGENYQPEIFDSITVKQSVLNGMIEEKLLLSASHDAGQRISNATLNNVIQSNPAFQREGQFDPQYYTSALQRINMSPEFYESRLRIDLLSRELVNNIQLTSAVTSSELSEISNLEVQTRDIAYGIVSAESYHSQVTVSDETVGEYYDSHLINYMAPERVKVDYLELSVDQLKDEVEVDDSALQQLYVANPDMFVAPEQRSASHILLESSSEDETTILTVLAEIQARLDSGADFAILAAEYSQDSGSANNGGDLGYFQTGVMGAEFENAVFSMDAIGEVSDPVKSEYGYHLIKLTGIRLSEEKPFAEVRPELEALYRLQQAEEIFYDKAERLADLSYENPDSLSYVAEVLELEIKTSVDLTRIGGSGNADEQKMISSAFADDVLVENLNSPAIELSKDHILVLHLNEHTVASQLPFESVAPAITEQLKFELASELAVEAGKGFLQQIKSGVAAASFFDVDSWQQAQSYRRDSEALSPQISEFAFALAKPVNGQPEYAGFIASNGNYIIVALNSINKDGIVELEQEKRDQLASYLRGSYGDSEVQAFITLLKSESKIEVFSQYLQ